MCASELRRCRLAVAIAADAIAMPNDFDAPGLFDWLETATAAELDALPFGVIAMNSNGLVDHYNASEATLSGLTPERLLGRHFFRSVAPCCNNSMVAHRYLYEAEIDDVIDYAFTFRVAPQKVRLRLLKRLDGRRMYLAVATR